MSARAHEKVHLLNCCYNCKTVYGVIPLPTKNFHRIKRALHELAVCFTEFRSAIHDSKEFAMRYAVGLKNASDLVEMICYGASKSFLLIESLTCIVLKLLECTRRVLASVTGMPNEKNCDGYLATFVDFRIVDLAEIVDKEINNVEDMFTNLGLHVTMLEAVMEENLPDCMPLLL
uniref:Uncharacterized protein n=1 Tax=Trichuris muris TaxID=70415 RepID=A0A5S6Q5C8_TRIMR